MIDKKSKEIGKRLRQLRKDAELTQASLSDKSGVPANTIARLERGEHRISQDTMEKLAKALRTTASAILGF
jgi:transcriptional regulator with XRE-family HTH domain